MANNPNPITLKEIVAAFPSFGVTLKMEEIKENILRARGYSTVGYMDKYSFDQTIQAQVQKHTEGGYRYNGNAIFEKDGTGHYKLLNSALKFIPKKPDEIISELVIDQPPDDIEEISRTLRVVNSINRNKTLVAGLKKLYDNQCQLCRIKLHIGNNISYSEVHHIRPLGQPHNGPDTTGNMMVVCPNCHVQLDFKSVIISIASITCIPPHQIDIAYIDYHNNRI